MLHVVYLLLDFKQFFLSTIEKHVYVLIAVFFSFNTFH